MQVLVLGSDTNGIQDSVSSGELYNPTTSHEGWSIYGWQEHPRDILTTALRSESSEAREEAKRVINLLGSRGHHGYRDLLRNNS